MNDVRQRLDQLRERWEKLELRYRIAIIAGAAVLGTTGVMLSISAAGPEMAVLFSNMSQDDAARAVDRLEDMNMPYELQGGGSTILVPADQVHETRLTLASDGVMQGSHVGYDLFDTQPFGESDFSEQVRYHRALEGELSRTISYISGIESARVHLVLENRSLFAADEAPASASVALRLRPGWQLRDDQVRGVVNLVSASVRGLESEKVTVVDGQGRSLTGIGTEDPAADALSYRTRIEQSREHAIQDLLDSTLGEGKARVTVAADVDFTREEIMEERYDPEAVATRSFEIAEEMNDSADGETQGVAGAASNLPGGNQPQGDQNQDLRARQETRNFEVSKVVRRSVEPVGRVKRLTIAVLVDGIWSGEEDARVFEPRSQEEMDRIRATVASAAGLNPERGDSITIECVPFASSEFPADPGFVDPLEGVRPYFPYIGNALGFLFALFVLIKLMMWNKQRKKRLADEGGHYRGPSFSAPTSVRELERNMMAQRASREALAAGFEDMGEDPSANEIRNLATKLAADDPERAARVIRGWLAQAPETAPAESDNG